MIIETLGLSYDYPDGTQALSDLSLAIETGKRLALLGPNGSGKTTLLLHLNGTLKPKSGEIRLDGAPARYERAHLSQWRRKVGLVLQDPDDQLFAPTVAEDVAYGPMNAGFEASEIEARTRFALEALRIADLANRPTHALSFGQKKRAAIAGVLAMRPAMLVLDEPSAGMDGHSVSHLMALLDHLVERGTTLVFSTHDSDLALAHADHVALFGQGRIIRHGPVEEVLACEATLQAAHLKRPWALEIGIKARQNGRIAADAPLPRSRREALALLERMT